MATLAQLLNIEHKQNSISNEDLVDALKFALTMPVVLDSPQIRLLITSVSVVLSTYTAMMTVIDKIQKATPAVKLATKMAAIPLNPAMAAEVAQDSILLINSTAIKASQDLMKNTKSTILNTDIGGMWRNEY